MPAKLWSRGDCVVHASRPEWGQGEVVVAEPVVHEGKPCQRLTIRFLRGGTKTLSTAFADLRAADPGPLIPPAATDPEPPTPAPRRPDPAGEPAPARPAPDALALAALASDVAAAMVRIPDAASDPFTSIRARLAATLDLYRFSDTGGSLLDWAAVQTGLADPLSRFGRHELEQHFIRFRIELDAHLRRLVKDARKQDPAALAELARSARPAAKAALRKVESLA